MDPRLIQAAQAGRRDAQAQLLRQLQDPWHRLCLALLGNVDDARDAVQDSAMRFLRDLPRFAGQSQLKTWAIGIALNVVREMKRQRRPMMRLVDGARPEAGPDAQAQLADEQERLRELLADLPPRQREALVLRFFEELSVEDAAAAMNCAPGTIKATVHQALRALRRKLEARHERSEEPTR